MTYDATARAESAIRRGHQLLPEVRAHQRRARRDRGRQRPHGRTLAGPTQPGINRIWWDLRFTPTKPMRLRTAPEYAPEFADGPEASVPRPAGQPIALMAPPGTYTVKLTVGG